MILVEPSFLFLRLCFTYGTNCISAMEMTILCQEHPIIDIGFIKTHPALALEVVDAPFRKIDNLTAKFAIFLINVVDPNKYVTIFF